MVQNYQQYCSPAESHRHPFRQPEHLAHARPKRINSARMKSAMLVAYRQEQERFQPAEPEHLQADPRRALTAAMLLNLVREDSPAPAAEQSRSERDLWNLRTTVAQDLFAKNPAARQAAHPGLPKMKSSCPARALEQERLPGSALSEARHSPSGAKKARA